MTELEDKQMDVMMRLSNLTAELEALKNKTEQNRKMAKDANVQANNATNLALSLEKVSVCLLSGVVCPVTKQTCLSL